MADDLAVVFLPQLPAGLYDLLMERGVTLVTVPEEEMPSLGCNVLAVRPGVVVMAEGNPVTQHALTQHGCDVHTFAASEVGVNGSGGPTCLDPTDPAGMKGLTPAELAVVGAVDRDRITDDLTALVAIPSITGDEQAVQTEVALRMTTAGLEVERHDADPGRDRGRPGLPRNGGRAHESADRGRPARHRGLRSKGDDCRTHRRGRRRG